MREASLPVWAEALGPGKVEIDAEGFYPEILAELFDNWPEPLTDEKGKPPTYSEVMYNGLQHEEVDQYWLETAFQVAKMDIQAAVSGTNLTPDRGGALVIFVKDGTRENGMSKFALRAHPAGKGIAAATKGLEAKEHYKRIRGGLV